MDNNKQENNLEERIINAAREVFTEKGFSETSMSDIAARVGINRPTLHYYFRTKERMFNAVFGSIVEAIIPKVQDTVRRNDLSVAERVGLVVDAYYKTFIKMPGLPLFIMREMHRDFDFMEGVVMSQHFDSYFTIVRETLEEGMKNGLLRPVPMRFLFMSFYSMLTVPFTMKPVCDRIMLDDGETFESFLGKWKPFIVGNITRLLTPEQATETL